jgi:pyruvate dehydrogenase kinase 2/3/4
MFLHRELPIRLAHRVRDLDSIPHMSAMKSTRDVRAMYAKSFEEIRSAPTPNNAEREKNFFTLISNVYSRHSSVLLMIAKSAYELRKNMKNVDFSAMEEIHQFLDSFYMSRIGESHPLPKRRYLSSVDDATAIKESAC